MEESPQARRKGCRTGQTDAQAAVRARRQLEAEVESRGWEASGQDSLQQPRAAQPDGAPLPRRSGGKGHGDSVLGMGLQPTLPGQKSWGRETLTF